jgi:hypothetical protein
VATLDDKQVSFSLWVLLHPLVIAFGALNYDLKDDLTKACATFCITYSALLPFFPCSELSYSQLTVYTTAIAHTATLVLSGLQARLKS